MMGETPISRYASTEMQAFFTPEYKYTTWRKLWTCLAKAEKELGLSISSAQINEMEQNISNINFTQVTQYEKKLCHDVMAHIHAFGDVAPLAKGIIHLGATSCYVTDNTDLIQMKEGLSLLLDKLIAVIKNLKVQAEKYASLPCLSYTHLQAAQPTSVGKRIALWIQDLLMDLHELEDTLSNLQFLGIKGATGTQASFLTLFKGDSLKVNKLEELVAKKMGFSKVIPLSGQTYTRKQDVKIFNTLSSIAITAHKFSTDLRLLAHMKEMEEPFGKDQVGSSAMPHKRNPTRSERLSGLSRYLISLSSNPAYTAATQWLERSLDDSSNRRLCIPEAFLVADSILNLLHHLSSNLVIYPKIIEKRLAEELPYLATEQILMAAAEKGQDRQALHEALRKISHEASSKWKLEGEKVDLMQALCQDPIFNLSKEDLSEILKPENFIGRAPEQVKQFIQNEVDPILERYKSCKSHPTSIEI
jgi:adenylosuccinate lyase